MKLGSPTEIPFMFQMIFFKLFIICLTAVVMIPVGVVVAQNNASRSYRGMCDASAAVALDENTFIVANDEDNDLRIYNRDSSVELQRLKLSEIFKTQILDGKNLEIDLEGTARLGNEIYWIGSHSTNKTVNPDHPDTVYWLFS